MKPKRNPDAVYKVCMYCGTEWNVSVKDNEKYYVCPKCRRDIFRYKQHKN